MSIHNEADLRRLFDEFKASTVSEMKAVAETAIESTLDRTFKMLGINTSDPLQAQRQFMTLREITDKVWDPEYRKDLEFARVWRLEMAKEDGAAVDLRHARSVRKFVGAVFNKVSVSVGASAMIAGLTIWWNDILHAIQRSPPPSP